MYICFMTNFVNINGKGDWPWMTGLHKVLPGAPELI